MKRSIIIGIGLLMVLLCVGVSVAATVDQNDGPDSADDAARLRAVASVDETVDKIVTGFKFEESIRVASPRGEVYTMSREDFARMVRAEQLRDLREPYSKADVLVRVTDEDGTLVGYFAKGVGVIPRDVAEAPGFDPCTLRKKETVEAADGSVLKWDPCTGTTQPVK